MNLRKISRNIQVGRPIRLSKVFAYNLGFDVIRLQTCNGDCLFLKYRITSIGETDFLIKMGQIDGATVELYVVR